MVNILSNETGLRQKERYSAQHGKVARGPELVRDRVDFYLYSATIRVPGRLRKGCFQSPRRQEPNIPRHVGAIAGITAAAGSKAKRPWLRQERRIAYTVRAGSSFATVSGSLAEGPPMYSRILFSDLQNELESQGWTKGADGSQFSVFAHPDGRRMTALLCRDAHGTVYAVQVAPGSTAQQPDARRHSPLTAGYR
jgi:hypothetical protein